MMLPLVYSENEVNLNALRKLQQTLIADLDFGPNLVWELIPYTVFYFVWDF